MDLFGVLKDFESRRPWFCRTYFYCANYKPAWYCVVSTARQKKIGDAVSMIDHCLREHPTKKVGVLRPIAQDGRTKYQATHFNISAAELMISPTKIKYDETTKSILYEFLLRCQRGAPRSKYSPPPQYLIGVILYLNLLSDMFGRLSFHKVWYLTFSKDGIWNFKDIVQKIMRLTPSAWD